MAGFGRFKLTDALPDQPVGDRNLPASRRGSSGLAHWQGQGQRQGRKTSRPVPRASRPWVADSPPSKFARPARTIRPRMPKVRFAIGWSTSAVATSKPAASALNERHH